MILLIQALPMLALVGLLVSGRAKPPLACGVAILATLPAAWLHLPPDATLGGFAVNSALQGLWVAIVPVGVMAGGLLFHAAISKPPQDGAAPAGDMADLAFSVTFLLGPFTEAVTGFGVGSIFAIGALRRAGLGGAPVAAMAMLAQIMVPWGGLGPGTAVGAALAGVSTQDMALRNAVQLAAALPFLLLLFWGFCAGCGLRVSPSQRIRQALWLAAMGAMLVGWHYLVPWEVCGLLTTGPLLAIHTLRTHPPQGWPGWRRALAGAFPYLLLAAVLLGSRAWPGPPALDPLPGMPKLPLNHAMVALWVVALVLLAMRRDALAVAARGLQKMPRTALTLVLFVLLARTLANAGVPQALALALAGAFGGFAPYAAPLLAAGGGFVTGTNTGGNSAMMPLQAALGNAAGLPPLVLPAVQNGTLTLLMAPQLTAVVAQLAGGLTLGAIWRLLWPVALIGIAIGMAAVALG